MNGIHEVVGSTPVASNLSKTGMSDPAKTTDTDLDPDIAELIAADGDSKPSFDALFNEGEGDDDNGVGEPEATTEQRFPEITAISEKPKPLFSDKTYYKKLLTGEGDISQKVHRLLTTFLTTKESKDRSRAREQLLSAFWDLVARFVPRIGSLPVPNQMLIRYGVLSPQLLSIEQQKSLASIIVGQSYGQPIYYLDEWLGAVATGQVKPSAVDEVKHSQKNQNQKVSDLLEKRQGKYQGELSLANNVVNQRQAAEVQLKAHIGAIVAHDNDIDIDIEEPYSQIQKQALTEIGHTVKQLAKADRDLASAVGSLKELKAEIEQLKQDEGIVDDGVDEGVVDDELQTVRQMAKMAVGRQGNHFPIAMKQYLRGNVRDLATRENVIKVMAQVEQVDPGLFLRTFKGITNRIVPYTILMASYGDLGVCWEPFDSFNRATSRGRIAIPLYPKDLDEAVISALADLRWQVAKERAQHYWMEEGLTGYYYQWFSESKQKGDVRDAFIQDYILWVTKEKDGMQKLERDVRGVFWRLIPFPQTIKDNLKDRGFVYSELYKKDQNRARSDGY